MASSSIQAKSEESFDELTYLQSYPDVAEAVARGAFDSGWQHFQLHGRHEGRHSCKAEPPVDRQVNVYNFGTLMDERPLHYSALRFDPNNDCNLRCVYCHNHRSKETIDTESFSLFVHSRVLSVSTFQIGCIMEPTLDGRLADLVLTVAHSPAKPTHDFMLQTNGLLLHRHDAGKLREANLTRLSISMDAANPQIAKSLRSGMSIDRVIRNVSAFRKDCPNTSVEFITTVTSENIDKLEDLINLGNSLGVCRFVFRELFYYPQNDVVDHSRMPGLMLGAGAFAAMEQRLRPSYTATEMIFVSNVHLDGGSRREVEQSKFEGNHKVVPRTFVNSSLSACGL